jgi:hypothetical protein
MENNIIYWLGFYERLLKSRGMTKEEEVQIMEYQKIRPLPDSLKFTRQELTRQEIDIRLDALVENIDKLLLYSEALISEMEKNI